MASAVNICNLALSKIGDNASISSIDPPDGSQQAEACGRFYPIALGVLLDLHPWSFATARVRVARLPNETSAPWRYAYAVPSQCRRILSVMGQGGELSRMTGGKPYTTDKKIDFEVGSNGEYPVLYTNEEDPYVIYIQAEPKPAFFSMLFVDALSWLLAAYLVGEVVRGETAVQYASMCQKRFQEAAANAFNADVKQGHKRRDKVPVWIMER